MESEVSTTNLPNAKCAEIHCQTSTCFTILCTFCDLKTFEFDEYVQHFKREHFKEFTNSCSKTEEYLFAEVKKESDDSSSTELEDAIQDPFGTNDNKVENPIDVLEIPRQQNVLNNNDEKRDVKCKPYSELCGNEVEERLDPDWQAGKLQKDSAHEDEKNDNRSAVKIIKEKRKRSRKKKTISQLDDDNLPISAKTIKVEIFKCETCEKRFKIKKDLRRHIKLLHKSSMPYKCHDCEAAFFDERPLQIHILIVHKNLTCSICAKKFKILYLLEQHMLRHTGNRKFQCKVENCGKMFFTKKEVDYHNLVHTKERPFVCEVCGCRYRTHTQLKVHKRVHTGEKPYPCENCGKRFSTNALLKEHMPIHSSDRPHKCEVCSATFARPKALQHHKNLHLGVKKYVCKICGKACAQAAGLAGHMRTHNKIPFANGS